METSPPQAAKPKRQRWLVRLGWLAAGFSCPFLMLIAMLTALENSLIFFPLRYPEGDWRPTDFPFEDARFQAADGVKLHGWYVPHDRPRAAVLYCHGNGGNITHRAPMLLALREEVGASVLIFGYRGYGKSEGQPDEAGVLADARAARAWLARREGIAESDVVLFGESLGGAVAVDLAASDGARALILEATFSSIGDVAAHHYPFLPVRLLMRTRLDSAAKIGRYRGPLLMIHGDADTIVPYRYGRRLFEAANEPKQMLTLPGHDHNDPLDRAVFAAMREFLDVHSPISTPGSPDSVE